MAAAIQFEAVSKSFGARKVLDRVSLTIPAGAGFCLLGRSGTGKSVALRHIIGLVQPDEGAVRVEGQDLAALDGRGLAAVRQRMGFLFQNSALFDSMSVGDNVAFPMRRHLRIPDREIQDRARAKLEAVGLGRDYDKMPADLSGGMRKRAGILLVDEPSAGLDPITAAEVDDLLLSLKQAGTTLVVVTHNMPSARVLGDELAFLDQGRVLAQGTVRALDEHPDALVQSFMRSQGGG
jgi:phospholipid/cholesterol/gamma-HCH transport system ATP-binding protein